MPIQPPDVFGSFIAGKRARQDDDYTSTRNKLAQLEADNAPAEMQRRNKLADLQVQGAQQSLDSEKARIAHAQLSQALQSGNPRQFVLQQIPVLAQQLRSKGVDLASMDDASAANVIEDMARQVAGAAGIEPAQPDPRMALEREKFDASRQDASQRFAMDKQRLQLERDKFRADQNKPAGQFRALTPDEVQQAGLPPGTSAQIGPDGKIDVLSKRDNTGTLSQKDATTAKQKLTTIVLAKKQLADIKRAFDEGTKGINAFGPGQGYLPTQQGKKFDAAVGRMRSTLTALTRVPGVGAMSDYETKLDQQKFPDRKAYESVTAEQIQGIEDMLSLLENGYTGILGGQPQSAQAPQQAPQQQAAPRRVKVDAQGNVIGN